jgi:hypothetical protein
LKKTLKFCSAQRAFFKEYRTVFNDFNLFESGRYWRQKEEKKKIKKTILTYIEVMTEM